AAEAAGARDVARLAGVALSEPVAVWLGARRGTPRAEIERLLDAKAQALAFEPMDFGPLLGLAPGRATIGGVLAANLSGPRRIKAGAARGHFLRFTARSGRGGTVQSGGPGGEEAPRLQLCKPQARPGGPRPAGG